MNKREIANKIILIISNYCQLSFGSISLNSKLIEDLALDSIAIVELVIEAEDAFNIVIDKDSAKEFGTKEFGTINDIVKYIEKILNKTSASN